MWQWPTRNTAKCNTLVLAARLIPLPCRAIKSFLQIQPHETGHFFAHELRASVVDLHVLLLCFGAVLLVGVREDLERRLKVLLPVRVLLLEFFLGDAFGRRNKADAVADKEIELAVAVDVGDPNS